MNMLDETVKRWLLDPVVGKLVAVAVTLLVTFAVVKFAQRSLGRYVKDVDTRYRARKFVTFLGYLAALMIISIVFSDKLGGFTVAFGVAGAGIAFALQEVIASVAGWAAISVGNFYSPGDRVQVGGIRGDVIDVSILRTTLMEVGEWVAADLYTGRIVRVANSSVFKEPVFNYSGDFPFLWDEITLPVKYGSDWKLAREMLRGSSQRGAGGLRGRGQGKLAQRGPAVPSRRGQRRADDHASSHRQLDRVHGPLRCRLPQAPLDEGSSLHPDSGGSG